MHGTITVEEAVVSLDGENGIGNNHSLFGTGGAGAYTFKVGFMNWFRRTQAAFESSCVACDVRTRLAYGNGTWLHHGGKGVATSTDTIHWTLRTTGINAGFCCGTPLYGNLNGNPTWFIGPYNNRQAVSSTDAVHWTRRTIGTANAGPTGTGAYGDNMFMYKVGYNITVSTDAIHWKMRTAGGDCCQVCYRQNAVAYGNGLWAHVHSCYNGGMYASTDTIHWQARTHGLQGWYVYNVSHANGYWFIQGESCMSISTDTIHWSNRACNGSPTPNYTPVVYNSGHYMYGGQNGCLFYIKDINPAYDEYNCWQYLDDPFHFNDDISGVAISDSGQLMMSDGQGIYAMDSRRTRMLGGDGGNGCNGGGAGAGSMICDATNAWATTGTNGLPGHRKIRISWW